MEMLNLTPISPKMYERNTLEDLRRYEARARVDIKNLRGEVIHELEPVEIINKYRGTLKIISKTSGVRVSGVRSLEVLLTGVYEIDGCINIY